MTEPEKRLWKRLRERLPLDGTHFRRQVAIGPYVADFCCLRHRLIIEADGEQHGFEAQRRHDERRTSFLEEQGFRVVRFSNRQVMTEIDIVLDTIHAALFPPPPCGEGLGVGVGTVKRADDEAGSAPCSDALSSTPATPTPNPSPQGGGGRSKRLGA